MTVPFDAIVAAAQREGRLDPLAAEAGVSHKGLVPIRGRPLLAHVLAALGATEGCRRIRISVEAAAEPSLRPLIAAIPGLTLDTSSPAEASAEAGPQSPVPSPQTSVPVELVPSRATITDSVYAAAEGLDGPFVVTTADNVLLTPEAVRRVAARLAAGDDAVGAMARREAVLDAHPEGQRRFYSFRDGAFSNCNLYGLSREGLKLAEMFRTGGQFAKNPMRLLGAIGPLNLVILRYGLITLEAAFARLGRRVGVKASPVILEDGAHAIDVDNARTYAIASELLEKRAA